MMLNPFVGFAAPQVQRGQKPDDVRAGGNRQQAGRVQQVRESNRGGFVASPANAGMFGGEFHAEHQAQAAHVLDDAGIFLRQLLASRF